jgi:hypothetical protein
MPLYEITCPNCGPRDIVASIKEAKATMPCDVCEATSPQVFHPPRFVEDRLRFWKGPMGTRYSTALGCEMPNSRGERDRVAKERGVEFITLKEHLAENKEAAEAVAYKKHVDEGGDRCLDKPTLPADVWKPAPIAKV